MESFLRKAISFLREQVEPARLEAYMIHSSSPDRLAAADESAYVFHEEESHVHLELAWILEGSFLLKLGPRCYRVQANQWCLIDPGTPHRIGWQPDGGPRSILWFACRGSVVRLHLSSYPGDSPQVLDTYDVFQSDDFLLSEVLREMHERRSGCQEAALTYLLAYLTVIHRRLGSELSAPEPDYKQQLIAETRHYIARHLHSKLSLPEIAAAVSVSPSHLSLLFKQVVGATLSDYILAARIRKARELLLFTDRKLSDIAGALGFYDQFYFSKVFKQSTGLTPSGYRRNPERIEEDAFTVPDQERDSH